MQPISVASKIRLRGERVNLRFLATLTGQYDKMISGGKSREELHQETLATDERIIVEHEKRTNKIVEHKKMT